MNPEKKPEESKPHPPDNNNLESNDPRLADPRTESQVFSYTAPWLIYSLGFSCKPSQLYKIAVGSFLEEKENQVWNFPIFNRISHKIKRFKRKNLYFLGGNHTIKWRFPAIWEKNLVFSYLPSHKTHVHSGYGTENPRNRCNFS